MNRVISLYLPNWPIDRLRRAAGDAAPSADQPLVLAARHQNRRTVTAACPAALAVGIRPGMALAKAQMLVPGLTIHDAAPAEDQEGLHRLALWVFQRFSPLVAADPPDGIVIDCTGADHLHGGEGTMVQAIVGRLALSGVAVRAAIADSWGAAHAFARHLAHPTFVAEPGRSRSLLSALPAAALRLPVMITDDLRTLGFRTIGDLLEQPRAPLALRFGPELARRLDQALGEMAEPIDPIQPPGQIEARRIFAEPIAAAETIARYIGQLVTTLCAALEARGLGACRLDLRVHRVDNRVQAIRVGMALPTRDTRRLTRLLCDKIETIDPGFGIETMVLVAAVTEALAMKQTANALVETARPDISGLVDTLANRIGGRAIYRIAAVASDVPERSVQRIPAMAPDTGMGWPDHWPRPARLLVRPVPIDTVALLPDHPPASFTWQGVRRRVRCADGPERVFGEWWKRDAEREAVRDYFRVEDEAGERYWIYRAGDGEDPATGSHRWFLHGIFG